MIRFSRPIAPLSILLLITVAASRRPDHSGDHYEGVPPEIMPVPQDVIYSWLKFDPDQPSDYTQWTGSDTSAMRLHAWRLWAALTADSKQPAPSMRPGDRMLPKWETWSPAPTVFPKAQPQTLSRASLATDNSLFLELPPQLAGFQRPDSKRIPNHSLTRFQEPTQIVYYNRPLRDQILKQGLNNACVKQNLYQAGKLDAVEFEPSSMALKTVWMLVSAQGCDEVPVWDGVPSARGVVANPPSSWPTWVAVRTTKGQSCPGEKRLVDLDRFYWHRLDNAETKSAQSLLAPQAVKTGDYLLLVGMHVITREIPDWVWATFWWHDHPDYGEFAAGRPASVRGVWRNYLMDVTYDMERPWQRNGEPNAVFNPYLEAPLTDGTRSNCMTCHRRSVWPMPAKRFVTPTSQNSDSEFDQIVVTGRDAATATYFPEYGTSLRLSFLWTLSEQPACRSVSSSHPKDSSPP